MIVEFKVTINKGEILYYHNGWSAGFIADYAGEYLDRLFTI
jgi:hypothetical protein